LEQLYQPANAIWPLHMILSGKSTMDMDSTHISVLQGMFGWTLSFSRALHGGPASMRKWFEYFGVDMDAIEFQYQCADQGRAASGMESCTAVEVPGSGVTRVEAVYLDEDVKRKQVTSLLMYAPAFQDTLLSKGELESSPVRCGEQVITIPATAPSNLFSTAEAAELKAGANPARSAHHDSSAYSACDAGSESYGGSSHGCTADWRSWSWQKHVLDCPFNNSTSRLPLRYVACAALCQALGAQKSRLSF
jgi:hypothetical protein